MLTKLKTFLRKIWILIKHRPVFLVIKPEGMAMIRDYHSVPFFSIFVYKEYRGQGQSIKLLNELFEMTKQRYDSIFGIITKGDERMWHVCKKLDFKKIGEFNNRYFMVKRVV